MLLKHVAPAKIIKFLKSNNLLNNFIKPKVKDFNNNSSNNKNIFKEILNYNKLKITNKCHFIYPINVYFVTPVLILANFGLIIGMI